MKSRLLTVLLVLGFAIVAGIALRLKGRSGADVDRAAASAPGFARVRKLIEAKDWNNPTPGLTLANASPVQTDKIVRSDDVWKASLSAERYRILRGGGTERPFSSPLESEHRKGVFRCAACGHALFDSAQKYDSGTGWPSFYRPVGEAVVWYRLDHEGGLRRTEVRCLRCDSHLGHVFDDGPRDHGGRRYCMDGAALEFVPKKG